jgi:hypothetical protein
MRLVIDLREILEVEMGIHLRTGDARVAKQLLHRAKVSRGLQQMRCERMAKHMRMNMPRQAALDGPGAKTLLDRARRETPAGAAQKKSFSIANR